MKYWTGIGARKTPLQLRQTISALAHKLESLGWTLRSGGATGFDTFSEEGISNKEIFLPWAGFNNLFGPEYINWSESPKIKESEEVLKTLHPNYNNLTSGAKKLHLRNIPQCCGRNLDQPSKFLVCWTPSGAIVGGSATAINLALKLNIPVFNLALLNDLSRIKKFIS